METRREPKPTGRPKTGEGIVKGLVRELEKRGRGDKLAKSLIDRALDKKADWRLMLAVYDFLFKVYQHDEKNDFEDRLRKIEEKLGL